MYGLKNKKKLFFIYVCLLLILQIYTTKSTELHKTFCFSKCYKNNSFKIALFIIIFRFEEFLFIHFLLVLFSGIVFVWELSVIRILKWYLAQLKWPDWHFQSFAMEKCSNLYLWRSQKIFMKYYFCYLLHV